MYGQGKGRNPRNTAIMMDWVHIIIGVLIVALAVIIFLNPEENQMFFPAVFLLAAVLNIFNGVHKYRRSGRDKKKKVFSVFQFLLALLLLAVMAVSAVSIWRG